jgi:hypothetical protein
MVDARIGLVGACVVDEVSVKVVEVTVEISGAERLGSLASKFDVPVRNTLSPRPFHRSRVTTRVFMSSVRRRLGK